MTPLDHQKLFHTPWIIFIRVHKKFSTMSNHLWTFFFKVTRTVLQPYMIEGVFQNTKRLDFYYSSIILTEGYL